SRLAVRGLMRSPAASRTSPVSASIRSAGGVPFNCSRFNKGTPPPAPRPRGKLPQKAGRGFSLAIPLPLPARQTLPPALGALRRRRDIVERQEQRRCRQFAAAVDADIDMVLGVEFEIEPRAAIGNDPGGKQILARGVRLPLVVVEEHAGAAVHLRDD